MRNSRSDNTMIRARTLQLDKTIRNFVGRSDRVDFYKFRTSSRINLTLALSELQANADVRLFDRKRKLLAVSNRPGTQSERISTTLAADTYFIQVQSVGSRNNTRYSLQTSTTPNPTTPNPTVSRYPVLPGLVVNPSNRSESLDFFRNFYRMDSVPSIDWTGSVVTNNPGATSDAFKDAVVRRVNYFRAMAGVPANVTLDSDYNRKAQAAALMMSANNTWNHSPPSTWKNYTTEGAEGAKNSNLFVGWNGWSAIDVQMQDPGANNYSAVHRRWILYPQTQKMGTGDVSEGAGYSAANALWVFDTKTWDNLRFLDKSNTWKKQRPLVREAEGFVAWTPRGYVPSDVVYARWSFSLPDADFSAATVIMTDGSGSTVPLTQEQLANENGFGENTIVWRPYNKADQEVWSRPATDEVYTVNIQNVLVGERRRNFTYQVTVMNTG